MSEVLLYGGIAVCSVAVISAIIATVLLCFFKARLNRQLDAEYGKRGR